MSGKPPPPPEFVVERAYSQDPHADEAIVQALLILYDLSIEYHAGTQEKLDTRSVA